MDNVLNQIKQIGEKYARTVQKITLFGSRARGDNHSRSDYDIAVYFKDKQDYQMLLDLEDVETLLNIDVTVFHDGLDGKFKNNLALEEVIIYE